MKKPALIIIILLALVGGPLGGYFYLQHRIEQNIRAGLEAFTDAQSAPATFNHGDVRVDLWGNEATLKALQLTAPGGREISVEQVTLLNIRAIDTSQDLARQLLSFQLLRLSITDPSQLGMHLSIQELKASNSNLAALLTVQPGHSRKLFTELRAETLGVAQVDIKIAKQHITIDKVTIQNLSPKNLGLAEIENVRMDGHLNIRAHIGAFKIRDTNFLAYGIVIGSPRVVDAEARKRRLRKIGIGALEIDDISITAADGTVEIRAIELDALDGGKIGRFRLVGLKQSSTEKTATNIELAEFLINNVDYSVALRPSDPRRRTDLAEMIENIREFKLDDLKITGLKGKSAILSGGLSSFHIQDLRDGLFTKLTSENASLSLPGTGDIKLAKLDYNISGRMGPFASHGDYAISSLIVRPTENEQAKPLMDKLGLNEVELSIAGSFDWDVMKRQAKTQQKISIKNAAEFSTEISMNNLPTVAEFEALQKLIIQSREDDIELEKLMSYLSDLRLDRFNFAFHDRGLVSAALQLTADKNRQPVEVIKAALRTQLEILAINYFGKADGLVQAKAINQFLETGGRLGIDISTPGDEPILSILALANNPALLRQKVKMNIRHQP